VVTTTAEATTNPMTAPHRSPAGTVLSVNVGMPADVSWHGRTVHTGIWKRPVDGPVMARRLNLDGDGQGDKAGHGGEQRAIMVYQVESYRHWEHHLGLDPLEHGAFGENLTVTGLVDDKVCIGDRYRIGGALLEVTQPRVTCFRVGLRLGQPQMPGLLVAHHRPGFYLRVLEEGQVRAGDTIELTRRGPHALTVAEADALLYLPDPDIDRVREAAQIPALSPGWRQSFQEMVRAHDEGTATPTIGVGAEPGWQGFRALRVRSLVHETGDVLSIEFEPADHTPLPAALPGQYLTVRIEGAGDPAPLRSYSISSAPGSSGYRISVKREPDGLVSRWLHDNLHIGDAVPVAAPRGEFTLDSRATNAVILISAGIGITPTLAMLHALAAARSARPTWWLYAATDLAHHAFVREVADLIAELPNGHSRVFYTRANPPRTGAVAGRLTQAALAQLNLPSDATVYTCGPQGFMDAISAACANLGITDIRSERFGGLSALNPGIVGESGEHHPHAPDGPVGAGPLVSFARSGLNAPWSQDHYQSLLEFAEACDVPTRWTCRSGVCRTCSTRALSGAVEYTSPPLVPPADGEVLLCCSVPSNDLILDM
jgi:ferredoxin-NADP reductase/MOSC domain-containing protein YiiM/ferredoxin